MNALKRRESETQKGRRNAPALPHLRQTVYIAVFCPAPSVYRSIHSYSRFMRSS